VVAGAVQVMGAGEQDRDKDDEMDVVWLSWPL